MVNSRLQETVLATIADNWGEEIEFLQALVGEQSVLGNEAPAQQRIAQELTRIGFEPELWQVDEQSISSLPGYSRPEWSYINRPNVSAGWPGAGGGRSLLFNGHVDVVPVSPQHHWQHDPWAATVVGNRMYGRGAADMKGGIAAMIYAVRALREAGVTLAGDLLLDTVIEEECTGNGTLAALARRGQNVDGAIIPEPFNQSLLTAQVGVMWVRITVRGQGAHVLGAKQAVNAIDKAGLIIDAIKELERAVNEHEERPSPFRDHPHPLNYNVGTIRAGDWASSVPPECTLEVRISAFPGESLDAVAKRFSEHLIEAANRDGWLAQHPPQIEFFAFRAEGCLVDESSELFTALDSAHGRVVGGRPERYASTATTDVRFFNLYQGVPATCYGPVGANLHAPDEWVDLSSVRETTAVLALAAMEWCGVSEK